MAKFGFMMTGPSIVSEEVQRLDSFVTDAKSKIERGQALFCETVMMTAFQKGATQNVRHGLERLNQQVSGGVYNADLIHPLLLDKISSMIR